MDDSFDAIMAEMEKKPAERAPKPAETVPYLLGILAAARIPMTRGELYDRFKREFSHTTRHNRGAKMDMSVVAPYVMLKDGMYVFTSEAFRDAAVCRYGANAKMFHDQLAQMYFDNTITYIPEEDPQAAKNAKEEAPYHLAKAEQWARLEEYIYQKNVFDLDDLKCFGAQIQNDSLYFSKEPGFVTPASLMNYSVPLSGGIAMGLAAAFRQRAKWLFDEFNHYRSSKNISDQSAPESHSAYCDLMLTLLQCVGVMGGFLYTGLSERDDAEKAGNDFLWEIVYMLSFIDFSNNNIWNQVGLPPIFCDYAKDVKLIINKVRKGSTLKTFRPVEPVCPRMSGEVARQYDSLRNNGAFDQCLFYLKEVIQSTNDKGLLESCLYEYGMICYEQTGCGEGAQWAFEQWLAISDRLYPEQQSDALTKNMKQTVLHVLTQFAESDGVFDENIRRMYDHNSEAPIITGTLSIVLQERSRGITWEQIQYDRLSGDCGLHTEERQTREPSYFDGMPPKDYLRLSSSACACVQGLMLLRFARRPEDTDPELLRKIVKSYAGYHIPRLCREIEKEWSHKNSNGTISYILNAAMDVLTQIEQTFGPEAGAKPYIDELTKIKDAL